MSDRRTPEQIAEDVRKLTALRAKQFNGEPRQHGISMKQLRKDGRRYKANS